MRKNLESEKRQREVYNNIGRTVELVKKDILNRKATEYDFRQGKMTDKITCGQPQLVDED